MISDRKRIANDLYKHHGALVSVAEISRHFKIGKNKARHIVRGLREIGQGTGKRYFYEDVAEAVINYIPPRAM